MPPSTSSWTPAFYFVYFILLMNLTALGAPYKWNCVVLLWLPQFLSIMSSRFICVLAWDRNLFLFFTLKTIFIIWKDPDAGKEWRWEKKGMTEDEMVGWHLWLNGHEWVTTMSWWWTGRPGVLQSTGSQRVRHNWVTELNWRLHSPHRTFRPHDSFTV